MKYDRYHVSGMCRRARSSKGEMDVFVLGGLPLCAKFNIEPDDASVGYTGGVTDISLYDHRGKPALWAENRMSKKDWDTLTTYISKNYTSEPDYDSD